MHDSSTPVLSLKALLLATLLATLLAFSILITAILPAEFGLDPTGIGAKMGLTALAPVSSATPPTIVTCPGQSDSWKDSVKITVPANSGLEYKFFLQKGATLDYSWKTDGGALYFDFHGEPQGDTTGYFKSFKENTKNQSDGALLAPFTGRHGWYWENKTDSPITVLLNTKGEYRILGLMH
jgi:hypothetical protein